MSSLMHLASYQYRAAVVRVVEACVDRNARVVGEPDES